MKRLVYPEVPSPEAWLPFLRLSYDAGYYSNFGPNSCIFEAELKAFLGTRRDVVTVANATVGLAATLLAMNVRGLVAIPAFTFPATASAVYQAGCDPIVVDVCERSWEMDPAELNRVLDQHSVAAIIHVRPFGLSRDLDGIGTIARVRGLPLIVDAAAGFGGRTGRDQPAGDAGVAEVFSFHATKPLGVGEGGAVIAESGLAAEIRNVTNFALGRGKGDLRWGVNGKMSEFHAAVGRAALAGHAERLARRGRQVRRFSELLDMPGTVLPYDPGSPPWQVLPVRLPGSDAGAAKAALASVGYETRVYYEPAIAGLGQASPPPVATRLAREMLSLPIGPHIDDADQDAIAGALRAFLGQPVAATQAS
ncbi:DegT/DnrJ/EryC1/StrS family aminotransferase [uncultured Enterovirga sp.]|uniref:DegT/DnrJ/EryC1/StrS family aminotransferase n=1 Tax=uncultured Enterovirga sp. TaxID=2026352 RepID=UPI0035CC2CFC